MAYDYNRLIDSSIVGLVTGGIAGLIFFTANKLFNDNYCHQISFIIAFIIFSLIILIVSIKYFSAKANCEESKSKEVFDTKGMKKKGLRVMRVSTIMALATIMMAIATVLLCVATYRLGDIAEEQLNVSEILTSISNSQLRVSKKQVELMQRNLDLIEPNLKCWWNSTDFENHSITLITVINYGQLPGEINKMYTRQPKLVEVDTNYKVHVNSIGVTTPAYVIKGGERKVLPPLTSNFTKISVTNIYTDTKEIKCKEWVENITPTYPNK